MYKVTLFTVSGTFDYYTDSIPDFDSMNSAMREIKWWLPSWLIAAALSA
jgi:hypothetical protein